VYKEGTQHGLTLAEMAAITGNSYKTANMYYRKYNEIDLYVEAMANVTITDVDIFGNILDREESDELKIVKNNLCLL
jgi:DNA-binding ferritin-like protein (Dps family)